MRFGSLQIIIPVYNEAENIIVILEQIREKVRISHTIRIIYDFEEDDTLPVVKDYINRTGLNNILPIRNKYGTGVLNALRTGFDSCPDGVVLVVMADCSDDIGIIDAMFEKINQGFDMVCGSRYIRGGSQIGGPVLKKLMSRMAGVSLHLLTSLPTHDASNSFKMYRTTVLRDIQVESMGGFEIGMEILVKAYLMGYKIAEMPCVWHDRTAGKSRFKLSKWLPKYLYWYFYAVVVHYKDLFYKLTHGNRKKQGLN
jgi:glycosyltransferase involved in cell wall biosynthesis